MTFLAGCGGGHSTSQTARSTTSTAGQASKTTPSAARLSGAKARAVTLICRRAESPEDRNVIEQFAAKGVSVMSPNVMAALTTAARDVRGEAASARQIDPVLSSDMTAEALALAQAGHLVQLSSDEAALLAILHRRISTADGSGIAGCAGAQADALPAKIPTA